MAVSHGYNSFSAMLDNCVWASTRSAVIYAALRKVGLTLRRWERRHVGKRVSHGDVSETRGCFLRDFVRIKASVRGWVSFNGIYRSSS